MFCYRSATKANKIQLRHAQTFSLCELLHGSHNWDTFIHQLHSNIWAVSLPHSKILLCIVNFILKVFLLHILSSRLYQKVKNSVIYQSWQPLWIISVCACKTSSKVFFLLWFAMSFSNAKWVDISIPSVWNKEWPCLYSKICV